MSDLRHSTAPLRPSSTTSSFSSTTTSATPSLFMSARRGVSLEANLTQGTRPTVSQRCIHFVLPLGSSAMIRTSPEVPPRKRPAAMMISGVPSASRSAMDGDEISAGAGTGTRLHNSFVVPSRSEEHTSELQSQSNLVCRLLLEKKNKKKK